MRLCAALITPPPAPVSPPAVGADVAHRIATDFFPLHSPSVALAGCLVSLVFRIEYRCPARAQKIVYTRKISLRFI